MASSIGFRILSCLPSCYSSYGAWTLTPVGLAPTDHASLRWTHTFRYLSSLNERWTASHCQLKGDSRRLSLSPGRVGYSSEPIDGECLDRKQDHCDLDNDKLFGLRDDAERNDESRCSRRRMTYSEQSHECACSRERERGGQQPWTMDTGVRAKWRAGSYRERVCAIAADEPDSVSQDGIARAGGFRQRGKEEEIRGGAEGWQNKWTSRSE